MRRCRSRPSPWRCLGSRSTALGWQRRSSCRGSAYGGSWYGRSSHRTGLADDCRDGFWCLAGGRDTTVPLVARCVALGCHPETLARANAASGVRTPCGSGRRNHWGLVTVAHAGCCWITNLHHKQARQGRNQANPKYDLDHTRGILTAFVPTSGRGVAARTEPTARSDGAHRRAGNRPL